MCGINGITKNDRERVERMNAVIRHRGPDGSSVYEGEGVTLGHNRLAIIDLHDRSAQPMKSNDGRYVLAFNGEIYNFKELKAELVSDYDFKTEGDGEVILAAYTKWGKDTFARLKGIFALGLWDTHKRSLILVRDHIGVKPMYYMVNDGVLSFSSEIRALIPESSRKLDRESVALYFGLQYVPSPRTLVEGINKLAPGHILEVKDGNITISSFFNNYAVSLTHDKDLYTTIDEGVTRQLISDRPVGIFLSGGIDSSVVLHHMARHSDQVRSFSVDFEMVEGAESEGAKFNADAVLAKRTADIYGAKHTTFSISIDDVRTAIGHLGQISDEPVANPTFISQYLLSRFVREDGVVVALGGDGGDEVFGGYNRHRAVMAAHFFQKLPAFLRVPLTGVDKRLVKLGSAFPVDIHRAYVAFDERQTKDALKESLDIEGATKRFFTSEYEKVPKGMHPVDAFMRVDRGTWLPDESLARSDRSSMAHGLELRVPLLDVDVIEVADAISVYKKVSPAHGKKILRNTYRKHLPDYIFDQPKRGWISPGAKWIRDSVINETMREALGDTYYGGLSTLIDLDKARSMLDAHTNGGEYHLHPLWDIFNLQVWAREHGLTY